LELYGVGRKRYNNAQTSATFRSAVLDSIRNLCSNLYGKCGGLLKLRNKGIKHAKVEHEDGVMGHLAYDYVKD